MAFIEIRYGKSRFVILAWRYAIKFPRVNNPNSALPICGRLRQGLRCNLMEAKAWQENKYANLCPIVFAQKHGLFLVMPRARPMSNEEFDEWHDSDDWPYVRDDDPPFEAKSADAGILLDGRYVMIDYGADGFE